jgi:hypothetical protein
VAKAANVGKTANVAKIVNAKQDVIVVRIAALTRNPQATYKKIMLRRGNERI